MSAEATATERLLGQVAPLLDDGQGGTSAAGVVLVSALILAHEPLYSVLYNDTHDPPIGILFDADACPNWALGSLAVYAGATLTSDPDDAVQRTRIKSVSGQARGRPLSIVNAAKEELTGTKTVIRRPRFGDEFTLQIRTIDSETPDPDKVEAKIREQLPAHLILDYDAIPTVDFTYLKDTYTDFDALTGAYTDFDDMAS